MKPASARTLIASLLLAVVGCTSGGSPTGESDESIVGAPRCEGVPTPMCAPGTRLADKDGDGCEEACEPVACPAVMPDCKAGERVADLDGDGCALECAACPAILCDKGMTPADYDGDGCEEACKPIACPPVMPDCKAGERVADLDGDGCALECAACPAILCAKGTTPTDSDGDGCVDSCPPVACPPVIVDCPEGQSPADVDGDGCALECK